jgi:hypothetical protein
MRNVQKVKQVASIESTPSKVKSGFQQQFLYFIFYVFFDNFLNFSQNLIFLKSASNVNSDNETVKCDNCFQHLEKFRM